MIKYLVLFISIFASFLHQNTSFATTYKDKTITFDGDDFFAVTSEFDEDLSDNFQSKLLSFTGQKMYIYFDSPGGSVFSMASMIRQMDNSKIEFVCVARLAASAAFMMFQHCQKRLLLTDGILMAHNASGTFQGEFPRVRSLLDAIEETLQPIEEYVAKRLKVSYSEYKVMINNNLWLNFFTAPKQHAVDGILKNASCTKELNDSRVPTTQTQNTLFGSVSTTTLRSGCPLIRKSFEPTQKSSPATESAKQAMDGFFIPMPDFEEKMILECRK
jgi:ATP-dependent protease ClpP protease subunit